MIGVGNRSGIRLSASYLPIFQPLSRIEHPRQYVSLTKLGLGFNYISKITVLRKNKPFEVSLMSLIE